MRKKIILSIIVLILFGAGIYQFFFKKEEANFTLAEVVRGNIVEVVTETGQIQKGKEINLNFKNAGRIKEIYVKVGEIVKENQPLARLETEQLEIQLQGVESTLETAQIQFTNANKDVEIAQIALSNAKIALDGALEKLNDTQYQANENLNAAYEDGLIMIKDSYLKVYNAFKVAHLIQKTYFPLYTKESLEVRDAKDKIESEIKNLEPYLNISSDQHEKIDIGLSLAKKALDNTFQSLKVIREICDDSIYEDIVPLASKSNIDAQRASISAALINIANTKQAIASVKAANQYNIDIGQSSVDSAQGQLKLAQAQLDRALANLDLYQTQIKQAETQVELLENQIKDALLVSPAQGQIARVNKNVGEITQPMMADVFISLIPETSFQIETNIPEVDIVKVSLNDPCKITLDAFPEEEFSGKVMEIDPAQTVISGVVYYKAKISFDAENSKIKPGMTANVTIITDSKENVLMIPQRAIIQKDGKTFVRIPKDNNTFEEREIQTGLRGSEGEIEVISALNEGDKVITFLEEE